MLVHPRWDGVGRSERKLSWRKGKRKKIKNGVVTNWFFLWKVPLWKDDKTPPKLEDCIVAPILTFWDPNKSGHPKKCLKISMFIWRFYCQLPASNNPMVQRPILFQYSNVSDICFALFQILCCNMFGCDRNLAQVSISNLKYVNREDKPCCGSCYNVLEAKDGEITESSFVVRAL